MVSQILTIRRILDGVCTKKPWHNNIVDFSDAFNSIHKGKIEQILLANSLPKETIAAIMMLYKNMKEKVHSLDRDTDYFNIVTGMLQGDTLAPYLFIICLDYVFRMSIDIMKDKFQAGKGKKQKIPCANNYGCELCRWHSASGKYTCPSQNPAT